VNVEAKIIRQHSSHNHGKKNSSRPHKSETKREHHGLSKNGLRGHGVPLSMTETLAERSSYNFTETAANDTIKQEIALTYASVPT
jgi:hypothetical protein